MFYWFDPLYFIFVGPALLFMLYAQWRTRSAYAKWTKVANRSRLTGVQAAQKLLNENNLYTVSINETPGELTDHYDPRNDGLYLSYGVAATPSVAALAIVAHEIGHAEQDARKNGLMALRSLMVPAVNIGSGAGPILFFVGLLLNWEPLAWLGLLFFSSAFFFALVTLPVEIDASNRAMRMLKSSSVLIGEDEMRGARQVLTAAALTYVGSLLVALFQLLYYASFLIGGRSRE